MERQVKVLIVEDDLVLADTLEEGLQICGFNVCGIAANHQEAVEQAAAHSPDVAVVDVRLGDGDLGTALAADLLQMKPMGILYSTGNLDMVSGVAGVVGDACIRKPYRLADIATALRIIHAARTRTPCALAPPAAMVLLQGCGEPARGPSPRLGAARQAELSAVAQGTGHGIGQEAR